MIELSNDPHVRKLELELSDIHEEIREIGMDAAEYPRHFSAEAAVELSQLILRRDNIKTILRR